MEDYTRASVLRLYFPFWVLLPRQSRRCPSHLEPLLISERLNENYTLVVFGHAFRNFNGG